MNARAVPAGFSSPPPPERPRRTHRPDWLVAYMFMAPAAAIFAALITYPLVDGIATAFTDRAIAQPGKAVGFANFAALFADPVFLHSAWNSLLLTAGTVALKLVLGLASALVLSQAIPMRGLVRALAFLPWAVPGMIASLAWKWIFDEQSGVLQYLVLSLGLGDQPVYFLSDPAIALFSVAAAMVWQGLPFFTMMFLAALASIPADLHEAAAIDGAGGVRRFLSVTLPQMRGVIAVTVMLSTIWTFNSFEMVFVLTGGGPANRTHILPTLAYQYAIGESHLGLGSAVIVSVIPVFVVLIFLLTRRMLRQDLD